MEKYQEENEENKYKYFVAENAKKEMEASAKVKAEELKKTLKTLEKEKILNVELKHQVGEKEKNYSRVISEVQESNTNISDRFEDVNAKYIKV